MNMKVNFYDNNLKDYIIIQKKIKKKVLKNSLGCFDNLTKSKNEITINRIENDYIEHYQMPCKDHKHAELQISQQIKKKKKLQKQLNCKK